MEDGGWKMEDRGWKIEDCGVRRGAGWCGGVGGWALGRSGVFRLGSRGAGFCEAPPMAWGRCGVDFLGWASSFCGQCDWPQRRQDERWGSLFRMPLGKSDSVEGAGPCDGTSSRSIGLLSCFRRSVSTRGGSRHTGTRSSCGCAPDVATCIGYRPPGQLRGWWTARQSRSGSAGGCHPLSSLLERASDTA
jgi:hypothetical protein